MADLLRRQSVRRDDQVRRARKRAVMPVESSTTLRPFIRRPLETPVQFQANLVGA